MKKTFGFILVAICAIITIVSCNNNKQRQEKVAAAKDILTVEALATLDKIAEEFATTFKLMPSMGKDSTLYSLSEQEKLVKPTYLLDPKSVNSLVTKSQKVNALAILLTERHIRLDYNLPVKEADYAIASIMLELDIPTRIVNNSATNLSDNVKSVYEWCKENNEIEYFWKFGLAGLISIQYHIAMNADLFFSKISIDRLSNIWDRAYSCWKAVNILAPYDKGLAMILETFKKFDPQMDEWIKTRKGSFGEDLEDSKRFFTEKKDLIIAQRQELLK